MRIDELIVYRHFSSEEEELLQDICYLAEKYKEDKKSKTRKVFYDCMHKLLEIAGNHGFYGNIWHCFLANILVNNENVYSKACEVVGPVEGSINEAALHDIAVFKEFFDLNIASIANHLSIDGYDLIEDYVPSASESKVYNSRIRERICSLAKDLAGADTPSEMKTVLTSFYGDYGVGRFGLHKAFRILPDEKKERADIIPILNIAHVKLDDLVGYQIQKQKLIENTEAFVSGKRANNCLLYGDAGTGKSSSIKAIANEYYERGLRMIEIYKHDFRYLNDVISQIKNRNYKFIIYMDDLSFEEFETEYKYLKAVIEGGLEKKPKNVLIYATSNRRHLVRERFSDKEERDEDLHVNDTVQEKLSLSARFGVSIYFGAPDKKEYEDIVKALAQRNDVGMSEEELLAKANKWELSHGGRTGRCAAQFIDHLLGTGQDNVTEEN
ncbi:MAG: ATP-binding protein [Lachnospiraceae bacterium]|nr:ATP-binding protein [Lachnospiraceae bacterium]